MNFQEELNKLCGIILKNSDYDPNYKFSTLLEYPTICKLAKDNSHLKISTTKKHIEIELTDKEFKNPQNFGFGFHMDKNFTPTTEILGYIYIEGKPYFVQGKGNVKWLEYHLDDFAKEKPMILQQTIDKYIREVEKLNKDYEGEERILKAIRKMNNSLNFLK